MARKKTGKPAMPIVEELPDGGKIKKTGIYERHEPKRRPLTADVLRELGAALPELIQQHRHSRKNIAKTLAINQLLDAAAAVAQPIRDFQAAWARGEPNEWNPAWGCQEEVIRDATALSRAVKCVRSLVKGRKWKEAMVSMYEVGRLVERMAVRELEPRALATLIPAHAAKQANAKKAAERKATYRSEVEAEIAIQQEAGEPLKYGPACETVAEWHGVSAETVRNNVPNIWTAGQRGRKKE